MAKVKIDVKFCKGDMIKAINHYRDTMEKLMTPTDNAAKEMAELGISFARLTSSGSSSSTENKRVEKNTKDSFQKIIVLKNGRGKNSKRKIYD